VLARVDDRHRLPGRRRRRWSRTHSSSARRCSSSLLSRVPGPPKPWAMNLAINTAPTPLAAIQASRRRNGLAMLGIHPGHADEPLGRRWQGPQAYAEKLLLATARLYGRLGRVWPASLRAVFTCTSDHRPADPGPLRPLRTKPPRGRCCRERPPDAILGEGQIAPGALQYGHGRGPASALSSEPHQG
jgi:hypothetical protein